MAVDNPFVVIKNQWDLNSRRSNQNHEERISIVISDRFKINRTYFNKFTVAFLLETVVKSSGSQREPVLK